MRTKIVAVCGLLVALGTTALVRSAPAEPHPSSAVASITHIRTDSAAADVTTRLFASIQAIRRAQDQYFAAQGRYTADRHALTGYTPVAGAAVFVTAGPDWFVVRGEVPGITVQQLTVWRAARAPVISGTFSAE